MELQKTIQSKIKKISPQHQVDALPKDFLQMTEEVGDFIRNNHEIYREREKHSLQWAFKNSQVTMNKYFQKFAVKPIRQKAKSQASNCRICDKFICRANRRRRKRLKNKLQMYAWTANFITLLDVFLAVLMVLVITQLESFGEHLFATGVFFAVLIAVTKVTLDKFWITPTVHGWGWQMFNRINKTFQKNIATSLALLFVLEQVGPDQDQKQVQMIIDSAERLLEH